MKKHNKMKVDEVAALRYTDEKAYRAIMKKELGGKGMRILLLCIAMMAFLNFSYMDANSIVRALPLGVIESKDIYHCYVCFWKHYVSSFPTVRG